MSIKLMKIKAIKEKMLAAVKDPAEPKLSYSTPPIKGPSPTAYVVPNMK